MFFGAYKKPEALLIIINIYNFLMISCNNNIIIRVEVVFDKTEFTLSVHIIKRVIYVYYKYIQILLNQFTQNDVIL